MRINFSISMQSGLKRLIDQHCEKENITRSQFLRSLAVDYLTASRTVRDAGRAVREAAEENGKAVEALLGAMRKVNEPRKA